MACEKVGSTVKAMQILVRLKRHGSDKKKSYKLICILMSEISINQQDFWLPGVFYTGNTLRLGALS